MQIKTTIEVNGKRYDAVTGALLGAASAPPVRNGRNIDGFFRARTAPSKTARAVSKVYVETPEKTVVAAPSPAPKPHRQPQRSVNHARAHAPQPTKATIREAVAAPKAVKLPVHHSATANHTKAHTLQASQTLMRKSVQRPAPSMFKQAGTQGALQHAVPSLIASKPSAASIDPSRLARAQSVARSPKIAHLNATSNAVKPFFTPLNVQPVPPPAKPDSEDPNAPAPQQTNGPTDIFEHALANASHFVDIQARRTHFKKHARRHVASMLAGTLALVVIAGFAAYQNTPGLQFKLASIQAGVATNMPNFAAAGFAYNGSQAGNGKLTVGFSNISGNYRLVQQSTNLSNSDMIHTVGATDASGTPNYRTVQDGSTTVYRFDNTGATWITNGTWYTVSGNTALTDSQVESLVQNT